MLSPALPLNFDEPPAPPDWLVGGLIERETVTVMSADSGVGKSIICQGLAVALLRGDTWLGRGIVDAERVVYIDEENFARVVRRRLQAFGMTNADRAGLRYYCRIGVALGDPAPSGKPWATEVEETLEAFVPDLLVIDTAAAAAAVDVNDNDAVARFYARVLRPLASYCSVILLHHERKPAEGGRRHAGHAMMGARQWAGQADAHLALSLAGEFEDDEQADGTSHQRHPLKLEMPKSRDGASRSAQTYFSVRSAKAPDGTLRRLWLEVDEAPGDRREAAQREWALKVAAIIRDAGGELSTGALAASLGVDPDQGNFKRGLRRLHESGRLSRPGHGSWAVPAGQDKMPF